jgi:magnesium-transporting ATPase (P-type)
MNEDRKRFERKWFGIFIFLYVLIMIPFPFFYTKEYIPLVSGIPMFIFGWFVHTAVTFLFIYLFYKESMKKPEYQDSVVEED